MSKIALIFLVLAVFYSTEANPVPEPEAFYNIFKGDGLPEKIMLREYPFGNGKNFASGIVMGSEGFDNIRAAASRGAHGVMMINDNGRYTTTRFRK